MGRVHECRQPTDTIGSDAGRSSGNNGKTGTPDASAGPAVSLRRARVRFRLWSCSTAATVSSRFRNSGPTISRLWATSRFLLTAMVGAGSGTTATTGHPPRTPARLMPTVHYAICGTALRSTRHGSGYSAGIPAGGLPSQSWRSMASSNSVPDRFKAGVALYPTARPRPPVSGPALVLIGDKDDCSPNIRSEAQPADPLRIETVPDATHGFDNPRFAEVDALHLRTGTAMHKDPEHDNDIQQNSTSSRRNG